MRRLALSMLVVAILVMAIVPVGLAQCVTSSGGTCATGGCGACTTSTPCQFGGGGGATFSVSVSSGLSCDGGSSGNCPGDCDNPDTLRARGHVKADSTGGGTFDYIVCETVVKCGAPPVVACTRCTEIHETGDFERDLSSDMTCTVGSGQWQYQIVGFVVTSDSCDECSESPCGSIGTCTACTSGLAHAASCCITK